MPAPRAGTKTLSIPAEHHEANHVLRRKVHEQEETDPARPVFGRDRVRDAVAGAGGSAVAVLAKRRRGRPATCRAGADTAHVPLRSNASACRTKALRMRSTIGRQFKVRDHTQPGARHLVQLHGRRMNAAARGGRRASSGGKAGLNRRGNGCASCSTSATRRACVPANRLAPCSVLSATMKAGNAGSRSSAREESERTRHSRRWRAPGSISACCSGHCRSRHRGLANKLRQASPHWMRHSHARHALARGRADGGARQPPPRIDRNNHEVSTWQ